MTLRLGTWKAFKIFAAILAIYLMTGSSGMGALPQAGDLVFGHSDFDAPETLEIVRGPATMNGGVSQPDPWDTDVTSAIDNTLTSAPIQSVEFDNFGGIAHNVSGNLLGLNFGSTTFGGEIFSFATTVDPAPTPQSIGSTLDLDNGPTRIGGLSVSPDNTKIAVTGYDNQRLIVYDYTAGDTMGTGASLSGGRESTTPFLVATDTQGTAWKDNNTVIGFASDGKLHEVNATTMASTEVKDLGYTYVGGEFSSLAYNSNVSPYIYASLSSFANSTTTNTLYVLDPDNGYNLVKQLNLSTSLPNTARELALDAAGNLFISVFGGDISFIPDVVTDPAALTDDSPVLWFESEIPSGFNGIDIGFGEGGEVTGDYDDSGQVAQGDLDLVLLNWGKTVPPDPVPDGWINQQPTGLIGQSALDGVLLNWGNTAGSGSLSTPVPEPTTIWMLAIATPGLFLSLRRSHREKHVDGQWLCNNTRCCGPLAERDCVACTGMVGA